MLLQLSAAVAIGSAIVQAQSAPAAASSVVSTPASSTVVARASPTSSIVENYTPIGCYAEPAVGKILPTLFATDSMTYEQCASFCAGRFQFWGLEYGRECWCGNDLPSNAVSVPTTECNQPCAGDPLESCGAGNRLSVYNSTIPVPPPIVPLAPQSIGAYNYAGCYTEGDGVRALEGSETVDYFGMTVEICASICMGYDMFGIEYAGECFCGNSLGYGSAIAQETDCYFPCPGNAAQVCGAGNRLSLYTRSQVEPPVSSVAPVVPVLSSSTVASLAVSSTKAVVVVVSSSVAPSSSSTTSSSSSIPLSSSSAYSSTLATSTILSSSSSQLSSTSFKAVSSSSFLSSTTKSSSMITSFVTSTSTKSSSIFSTQTSTAFPWVSAGCYSDSKSGLKILLKKGAMSPEICAALAKSSLAKKKPTTFSYIALESGKTCLAGTAAPPAPTSMVGAKACTIPCALNASTKCGGKKMYDLYITAAATAPFSAIATVTAI